MTIDVSKLPRFIDKTTDCNFCGKDADIIDILVEGNLLKMIYKCSHLTCDSMKWLKRPAFQEIVILSQKAVDSYNQSQE